MKKFIILIIFFLLFYDNAISSNKHLYSTWDVIEVDTCASAWLIKRFVDKKAEFKFYPKGEIITEGVAFDTPDAEFRRYHNISTFESIIKKYKFKDPVLIKISQIIHDIEINFWRKSKDEESEAVYKTISDIITNEKMKVKCFEKSFIIFDNLYERLKQEDKKIERK